MPAARSSSRKPKNMDRDYPVGAAGAITLRLRKVEREAMASYGRNTTFLSRHPELVSGSTARRFLQCRVPFALRPWLLTPVQHDEDRRAALHPRATALFPIDPPLTHLRHRFSILQGRGQANEISSEEPTYE